MAADQLARLPQDVALAFAPLHKRHFGTSIGCALGLTIFFFTMVDVLSGRSGESILGLLNQYFAGYSVTAKGAFVGALWGLFVGWIGGWFVAFCRNLVLAAMVFWVRAKTNLQASRDFLDHL